jgi:hypothetical protein
VGSRAGVVADLCGDRPGRLTLTDRESTWANAAREGADLLDGTPAGARLDAMGRYFDHVGRDLARAAERRREVFTAQ